MKIAAQIETIALVVTYKRPLMLGTVLQSLVSQSKRPDMIIVVDNASNDETQSVVTSFINSTDCIDVIYLNTGDNLGGAGGFKFGFDYIKDNHCKYDYLWLMDDDLCPSTDCLETLMKIGQFYPDVGIIQPTRFDLDGKCAELSPVVYNLGNPFLINPKKVVVTDIYHANLDKDVIDIDGIPFEGPLIKKNVVDAVGSPVADFFIFYDDLDYAIRTKKMGFRIVLAIQAKATRLLKNNQSNDLISWKGYFMIRNFLHLHIKHGGNVFVKMKAPVYFLGFVARFIVQRNFGKLPILFHAFKDSFRLSNSFNHRP